MAEHDLSEKRKEYFLDVPQTNDTFFLKGSSGYDWGFRNRLARIFNPKSGKTVMLAIDHGYFQGPTTGLERIDVTIKPLVPFADALMCTRGILRSVINPESVNPVVMRASGGPSILKDLSNEQIAVNMEDALRMNVSAVAVQVFVGGECETQSINNMTRLVDDGMRYGMPVLGVTAVGKDLVRDSRYIALASRMLAELGAAIIKTYYCDNFEKVVAACPVPIIIAGGKKLAEFDALSMARNAIDAGASGVDMGRNIFQSDAPEAMLTAVRKVVHENMSATEALELYTELKNR
ncbi:MAG: 3-hydroxy-5-phosphonooxypentane-2,4-dione thiolase [Pseudomonadota bacterium]